MTRILIALAAALAVAVGGAGAAGTVWPETIRLPNGFQPEGIATSGETFYVGSIVTGAVYSGDVRTGQGSILVQPVAGAGRAAIRRAISTHSSASPEVENSSTVPSSSRAGTASLENR